MASRGRRSLPSRLLSDSRPPPRPRPKPPDLNFHRHNVHTVLLLHSLLVLTTTPLPINMDLLSFIHVADPTKVKVGEREQAEEEARLLDSTVWRIVLLLPIALDRADSELEASVEILFDESGTVTDASVSSHPLKKLRSDHGTLSGAASAGKSPIVLKQLLASSILNVEFGVESVATLPFVTSSISATPKHESGVLADFITGLNLRTIGASERSVVVSPVMTEAIITTHVASTPSATAPESEISMGSREVDSESLHEVFVLHWNIPNDSLMDNLDASREFIDHLAHPVLSAQICDMDYEELFTEFTRRRLESECEKQAGLLRSRDKEVENLKAQLLLKEAEAVEVVHLRTQKNMALEDENKSLSKKVVELQSLVSVKDRELKDVDATVTSLKSQNDGLADQVRVLETTCSGLRKRLFGYENLMERLEEFQNAELKVVNERVEKLDVDLEEMAYHLEEKFYPHLLTTKFGQRWLLTHGLKLVLVKCLNSSKYLIALGASISRSIEEGMQDGLAAGIDHGRAGRSLADIVVYNPSAEADFYSASQELREVDFRLLADLKSHKDASIEDVMNLLHLEIPLADAPGMDSLHPDIEQLKVPIHRSEDQVVLGETSLPFALSVSHSRVEQIMANITAERSALLGVWTPLSEPLSV
ncbi:hypothetical protein Tco_0909341 [Tanacetum coccineum]|uniref:Transposase (Putative), gypsy type n=1 Tax=Tanacetum coccineum TaxID=301880 RepID=A0ABQ5CPQ2_9ASTR